MFYFTSINLWSRTDLSEVSNGVFLKHFAILIVGYKLYESWQESAGSGD